MSRHELEGEKGGFDCSPPLLSIYDVLFALEQEGKTLPVRIPVTVCISAYFIRAVYVMESRAPRPGEPSHPPPMTLMRRPARDLNAHTILQELVEHDWNNRLNRDELSDDDTTEQQKQAAKMGGGGGGTTAAARLAAAHAERSRVAGPTGFEAAGLHDPGAFEEEDNRYGYAKSQAYNSKRLFKNTSPIWAEAVWWEPDLDNHRVEYLNAHSIRDLLRNPSSRKPRAILTQWLPPDDTAPPFNEMVEAQIAGAFFRMERRVNKHDMRNPARTLNERGSCEQGPHSDEVQVPGLMAEKIEAAVRGLAQVLEYVSGKRVLVLRVHVKLRRGAVYLVHGLQLTLFDASVPRSMDPAVLFAASCPSSRAELRKRIKLASQDAQNSTVSSPQGVAQRVLLELGASRAAKKARVMARSTQSIHQLRAGQTEATVTLGKELRQMRRGLSRSNAPGQARSKSQERDDRQQQQQHCLPGGLPQMRQSLRPTAQQTGIPVSAAAAAASAPAPRLIPPLFFTAGNSNSNSNAKPPVTAEEASGQQQEESKRKHAMMLENDKLTLSKMVSFAGALVAADDSNLSTDSDEQFERELEKMRNQTQHADDDDDDEDEGESNSDDDDDDAFFDTETDRARKSNSKTNNNSKARRRRTLHRDASMMRDKLTEMDKAMISAKKWLHGKGEGTRLLCADDIAAIELLREESAGVASKRLSQFRSSDGLVAPSLLFMSMRKDVHNVNAGKDLERFWDFREKLLKAKVEAAMRKGVLADLRAGTLG